MTLQRATVASNKTKNRFFSERFFIGFCYTNAQSIYNAQRFSLHCVMFRRTECFNAYHILHTATED